MALSEDAPSTSEAENCPLTLEKVQDSPELVGFLHYGLPRKAQQLSEGDWVVLEMN